MELESRNFTSKEEPHVTREPQVVDT
ncbi:Retrovirus-related Pol polyprotein from transposon 297, partial [Araneus ventricosus]